ncbi:hypothetical protein OFR22_11560 [Brachyspira hyodysenteriae]|uniref:hypothetical protein n=1 Tax=Brachyspira hyodysenteriae TaxID=159 RepID=UPI0022CD40F7|nr:hypothetical protein [Brachyspira hyodysenteriae]MCZ9929049.1 hypothetical protein [Brachyspira hyodysenteriae]MCZ9977239.1 hypothetical protein [Brachyspira hyodysenteriae]MCZ9996011.1 hypothetical protein [Brachyspira hyodysenteriae]MDA0044541.1 hypothetical protein [Brachyspira hyodysenteriae]MDA0061417.1 hypothetical protein [Brachyspira hyodysenteriae]
MYNNIDIKNKKIKELENLIKARYKESNNIKEIIVRYNDIILLFNFNLFRYLIINDELRCSWTDELTGKNHIEQYHNIEDLLNSLDMILS